MIRLPFPRFQRSAVLAALMLLAGCATTSKPTVSLPVTVNSTPQIEITNAQARVRQYGLVITGQVHLAPNLQIAAAHSVDIVVTGPEGEEIRNFTSQYFPAPKIKKRKPQRAHFTMVTYAVPPEGSVIKISVTPEPTPGQTGTPAPGNP